MVKKITILGGGTSGLVTALILKSTNENYNIQVVRSTDLGIIGVGEGTTEHWRDFLNICAIDINELVLETDATMKIGIKFTNWNGDGKSYFHSLHTNYQFLDKNNFEAGLSYLIANNKPTVPEHLINSTHHEPLEETTFQYHFNTQKLNDFLIKKCNERSIKIVDDKIDDVILDANGFVTKIKSQTKAYTADFFVDCSGFRRIIASKLGVKWQDKGKHLPMNHAIAFPTPRLEDIPSHTESNAMSTGWMWRIPTQERFGNGYVFCDDYITVDQAVAEAQSCFDHKIEIAKEIKFSAGYVDKFWVKNCVSLGLAGSFVEPLEASSIGTSIIQAKVLGQNLIHWSKGYEAIAEKYNRHIEQVAENIIDFVQLHYFTKRKDTEFWRNTKNIELTDFNKQTFEYFKNNIPSIQFFEAPWAMFRDASWIQVMHGLELLDIDKIKAIYSNRNEVEKQKTEHDIKSFDEWMQTQTLYTHRQSLEIIKNRKTYEVQHIN